jgi:multidrug resistance efflux pump
MSAGHELPKVWLYTLAVLQAFFVKAWKVLKVVLGGMRTTLSSARAWVLFILLVILVIIAYYVVSDRDTPFTTDAYAQAYVIQVAPRIEGQVVRVCVTENQAVTKGDLMFEIDPRPFADQVSLLEARRVAAIQEVAQMDSELKAAKADDARLAAEEAYARTVQEQETAIYRQHATTDRKYVEAVQRYKAAKAALELSRAKVSKAEQALAARIGAKHAVVVEAEAQLALARLNLDWTRVYAPANGYVTNVQLCAGSYIRTGTPVLTCIDSDQWWIVANLREGSLEKVRPGQRVGLTLNTYPGRIFSATVDTIGWGVNEGQGLPSGALPAIGEPANWIRLAQRFQVRISPQLPSDCPLRVGATASVAIYTREGYWLNRVTHTVQRIAATLEYLR